MDGRVQHRTHVVGVGRQSAQRIGDGECAVPAALELGDASGLLAAATQTPQNHAGQLEVLPDGTLPGHPEVSVVGDMMQIGVPGVAQVAIQSGRFAARRIIARVEGRPTQPRFHYRDKGNLATIARFRAVASIGPLRLSGTTAWLLWLIIHLTYLVCFKNRLLVLAHWAISFVGSGRSERTAPPMVFASTQGGADALDSSATAATGDTTTDSESLLLARPRPGP